jgi:2-polyprenyl-3-methyl-5-hydroxy-6-metoxy-1,4-benzoquinol methylase
MYNNVQKIIPSNLYNNDYFESHYYKYFSEKAISQKNFQKRLDVVKQFLKKGKLLEIGSAYGFFLELAKKGFEVFGIDIADCGIQYASKELKLKNVVCGDYVDVKYNDNFFDGICMFDTIEHLQEPHRYLEKANKELAPGGKLFFTTGDIDSLAARMQKSKWRLIDPPTHLYYFSRRTIKMLLEKYGFKIIKITYPGYYRSLAFMIYFTFVKENNKFTDSSLFRMLQMIPIYANLFDIMFVVAQKDTGERREL